MDLRTYTHRDLPGLAAIWNETFVGQPNFVRVGEDDLIRRVVGRPSFNPASLLVAARGDDILGFVHFGPRASLARLGGRASYHSQTRTNAAEGHIYAVVAPPSNSSLARDLLTAAVARLAEAGARRALLGPSWVHGTQPFYNGIAGAYEFPGLSTERRDLLDLAAGAGFLPLAEYGTPERDLSDRDQLAALRRAADEMWARVQPQGVEQYRRPLASPIFTNRTSVELALGPEVIAMAAYGPWEEYIRQYRRQLFGITSVQVAPRWRGKGLGKLILIRALEAAVEAGAEAAHLHVWRENKVAWDLYHRAVGFRPKHTWVTLVKDCSAGFSLQGPL